MIHPWNQPAWDSLARRLADDRMPHALLVHGPRGTGKRALADALAAAALCQSPDATRQACGDCTGCRLVVAGSHPDLHRIGLEEDSRQIKIDQVRDLSRKAALTSSRGQYQLFIIDPADRMNVNAANAVLKTLEEPRAGTVMVLVAEARHRLPITIRSRCQAVAVTIPDSEPALEYLAGQGLEGAQAKAALRAAGGAPLRALDLHREERVDQFATTIKELQGVATGQLDPTVIAERWQADHPHQRLTWMSDWLGDRCWQQARSADGARLTASGELASLTAMLEQTNQARQLLETNLRPELLIEDLLVRWKQGGSGTGESRW